MSKLKRASSMDMDKIRNLNEKMIAELFTNLSDKEIFDNTMQGELNLKELVSDYRKEISERILTGKIPKEESSLIEELIEAKVKLFEIKTSCNYRIKMMNNALSSMRGVYSQMNTIIYYLLLGKYPELKSIYSQLNYLKKKCNELRKENFEIKNQRSDGQQKTGILAEGSIPSSSVEDKKQQGAS